MACAAKMRMAKAYNGFIFVLVTRAILVNFGVIMAVLVVTYGIRFRTKLHHAKRHGSARKHMSHAFGTDHGLYILNQIVSRIGLRCRDKCGTAKKGGQ